MMTRQRCKVDAWPHEAVADFGPVIMSDPQVAEVLDVAAPGWLPGLEKLSSAEHLQVVRPPNKLFALFDQTYSHRRRPSSGSGSAARQHLRIDHFL
jgi:hypothetical protein